MASSVGFAVSLLFLGAFRLCAGNLMLGATLDAYPDSSCANTPSGLVSVTFSDDGKMAFGFQLSGLPESTSGGIHIHAGTRCEIEADEDADTVVGGHYWKQIYAADDSSSDPWNDVIWTSDSDGMAVQSPGTTLETGYDYEGNNGHAVVYHDAAGSRCGCGLLTPMKPTLTATITTYPNYTDSIKVKGTVVVKMMEDNMHMEFGLDLTNLEKSTTGGVHIHAGTTCDSADDVGGHYWTPDTDDDVWTAVTWTSDSKKSASSSIILDSGYEWQDNVGHAVVVHDAAGIRVGCGILAAELSLQKPGLTAEITTYPDYTGSVAPTGTVAVQMMADNMHMEYGLDLTNLEKSTTGGVHIHAGTTCDTADDVGGHYWTPVTDTDVWNEVTWESDDDGESTSSSIILANGYTYEDNVGHAVVVHDEAGNRVGCGILKRQDDEKRGGSRLYGLIGGLNKKLQASASTVQFAGLASVSVAAILAVVAFRVKKARAVKPVPYIATEATDSEEGGLLY